MRSPRIAVALALALPAAASVSFTVALPLAFPQPVSGQAEGLSRAEGWLVRTDRPEQDAAAVRLVDMPPGWHVTTGPAAIMWQPDRTVSGAFRVEVETYLFEPQGRREAFGFFVGGRELEGPDQRYLYFLIREGGEFLIKRRRGNDTEVVVDWSPAPSMVSFADRPPDEATAKNILALEAEKDRVRFFLNGEEVAELPRSGLSVDGIVGLRVNHALDLHVSRVDVEPEEDAP